MRGRGADRNSRTSTPPLSRRVGAAVVRGGAPVVKRASAAVARKLGDGRDGAHLGDVGPPHDAPRQRPRGAHGLAGASRRGRERLGEHRRAHRGDAAARRPRGGGGGGGECRARERAYWFQCSNSARVAPSRSAGGPTIARTRALTPGIPRPARPQSGAETYSGSTLSPRHVTSPQRSHTSAPSRASRRSTAPHSGHRRARAAPAGAARRPRPPRRLDASTPVLDTPRPCPPTWRARAGGRRRSRAHRRQAVARLVARGGRAAPRARATGGPCRIRLGEERSPDRHRAFGAPRAL